ncbi:MAG TPA: beta-eliminating lyase-related protein [Devosiaceae bacterium]|jgi:threonine aldolase
MFKLIQISDTHFSAARGLAGTGWTNLAGLVASARPDLVVHTGDLVLDRPDNTADHVFARAQLATLGADWLALPGNHDVGDGPPAALSVSRDLIEAFARDYGATHWQRDVEDWRLIGLNGMLLGTGLPEEEAEWDFLQAALVDAGGRELALFIHKPVFLFAPDEAQYGTATLPEAARLRLWDLLQTHGVRFVAGGHRHEYRVLSHEGIQLIWAPAASRAVLDETTLPLAPDGTRAGFLEYAFAGRTVMHRFVDIGPAEAETVRAEDIDLRSDVIAPPSAKVLEAITAAGRAPLGFSPREDVYQQRLTAKLTEAFGFEDGLFLPTGTMANQIAVRLWCQPGELLLAEAESHVAVNEAASVAGLNGVSIRSLPGQSGHLAPMAISRALEDLPGSAPDRSLRLVWLENTHNRAGGTVMPDGWQSEIAEICRTRDVPIHVDGARIFDAARAASTPTLDIAHGAASLTVCLNKGPGAPHGAMLLGSGAFIAEAAKVQKMFGGLWRPIGLLTAAAAAALEDWPARIDWAHERAAQLASELARTLPDGVTVPTPQTNIVMLQLRSDVEAASLHVELGKRGVRASNYRRGRLRFVTHMGLTAADIVTAAAIVRTTLQELENHAPIAPSH